MTFRPHPSASEPVMIRPSALPPLRGAGRERGIAILSVITVLVALLIIAIPFVIAMKLARERTEVGAARNRARFEAELIARAVASYVHKTHPQYEQQRKATNRGGVDADDTVDA